MIKFFREKYMDERYHDVHFNLSLTKKKLLTMNLHFFLIILLKFLISLKNIISLTKNEMVNCGCI